MSKEKSEIHLNGVVVRTKNRKVVIQDEGDKGVRVSFYIADQDLSERTHHSVIRNKVVKTQIRLSTKMINNMCFAYLKYLEQKQLVQTQLNKTL